MGHAGSWSPPFRRLVKSQAHIRCDVQLNFYQVNERFLDSRKNTPKPERPESDTRLKAIKSASLTFFHRAELAARPGASAGLPAKCLPHGLRKAAMRRLADGATRE